MDTRAFRQDFWRTFEGSHRNMPCDGALRNGEAAKADPCPGVHGMISPKKQRLLNLAYGRLPPGEAYFEVGTYQGKSLLSAMLNNPLRPTYACDNYSEFQDRENSFTATQENLRRFGLEGAVQFHTCDFREVFEQGHLRHPIGLYFYDGAHDEESQFDALSLVEPYLADEALVLVDDWRLAPDSRSFAKAGSLRAAAESRHAWRLMYELPARFNGDLGLWWNGVGVFAFQRAAVERIA